MKMNINIKMNTYLELKYELMTYINKICIGNLRVMCMAIDIT